MATSPLDGLTAINVIRALAVKDSDGTTTIELRATDTGRIYVSDDGLVTALGSPAQAGEAASAIGATSDAVVDAGAAGSVSAKLRRLTTDVSASLTAVANNDLVVSVAVRIPITSPSATLAAILTVLATSLPATTKRITIGCEDAYAGIRFAWNIGAAASATSPEAPGGVLDIETTKTVGDTIQVYAAAPIYAVLLAWVPRS